MRDDAVPGNGGAGVSSTEQPRSVRGRPRKWATEADRKRAYRERMAADLAEPAQLRRELRTERARSATFARVSERRERELDRTTRLLARALNHQAELGATIEQLRSNRDYWQSRARQLDDALAAAREPRDGA